MGHAVETTADGSALLVYDYLQVGSQVVREAHFAVRHWLEFVEVSAGRGGTIQ